MNARFWAFVNGGWVKLTLKPNQSLTHAVGGRNEEAAGCWYSAETWEHTGDTVTRDDSHVSADCDGPHENYSDWECPLDKLKAVDQYEYYQCEENKGIFRPDWQKLSSSQRDHFAEAMRH